jgi:HEAT repeat protein
VDTLVVPAWMAKALDSPDVSVRLRALETWAQSAPLGAVDPLILALEDKDERVQARATELIEQDMARESETEQ